MAKRQKDAEAGHGPAAGGEGAGAGHNSGNVAGQQLRSYIDRIEYLRVEIKQLQDDVKEIFAEAKGTGYDTKILRKVLKVREQGIAEFQEEETLLDMYLRATGILA